MTNTRCSGDELERVHTKPNGLDVSQWRMQIRRLIRQGKLMQEQRYILLRSLTLQIQPVLICSVRTKRSKLLCGSVRWDGVLLFHSFPVAFNR